MAYDEGLAQRLTEYFAERDDLSATEKKMFGGIAWMVNGNMVVGTLEDHLMVRVGKEVYEDALARPHCHKVAGNMRPMKGFVYVDLDGIVDGEAMTAWIQRGLDFALTLPAK